MPNSELEGQLEEMRLVAVGEVVEITVLLGVLSDTSSHMINKDRRKRNEKEG